MNEPVLPHWSLIGPSLCVIVTVPQESLPVAVPVGLGWGEPGDSTMASGTSLIVGPRGVVAVQVRMNEPVLPHWSLIGPSLCVIVTVPQESLPVAVPLFFNDAAPAESSTLSVHYALLVAVLSTMVMV